MFLKAEVKGKSVGFLNLSSTGHLPQNQLRSLKQADSWVSLDLLSHTVCGMGLSTLPLGRSLGVFDVYLRLLVSEKRADFPLILLSPHKSTLRKQLSLELGHNNLGQKNGKNSTKPGSCPENPIIQMDTEVRTGPFSQALWFGLNPSTKGPTCNSYLL